MAFRSFKRLTAAADHIADWCEQFQKNAAFVALFKEGVDVAFLAKVFTGRRVTLTYASATNARVEHGLGRVPIGAFILSSTNTSSYPQPTLFSPSATDTYADFGVSGGAATYIVQAWIF